jgi:hypothetical protein
MALTATPSGSDKRSHPKTGRLAALDHRLIAVNPSGSGSAHFSLRLAPSLAFG